MQKINELLLLDLDILFINDKLNLNLLHVGSRI